MRLTLLRLLALLLLLPASMGAQTFFGDGGVIPDDGNTIAFDIPVSGLPSALNTSNFGLEGICINVVHNWVTDISVVLRAPDGTTIPLLSGVGGDTDGFVNTCLSRANTYAVLTG